jgi:nicotinamidase-related amidase
MATITHSLSATAQAGLSQLVIVDVQTRLAGVMQPEAMQVTVKNCGILISAAAMLEVPAVYTEQYPQGLGNTVPELLALLAQTKAIEKTVFSCAAEPKFMRQLTGDRPQIILAGMEAHICVLQTALSLVETKQVFVVEDAIISRNPANKANAIARLRDAGCIITNTESVVFEWVGKAEGDTFKAISKLIR